MTLLAALLCLLCTSRAGAQPALTPEQARAAAKDAYIFAYPLVLNYRTMYMQAIKDDGQMGKWLHLGTSSPADTDIVTPNNDSPYSYAWVDLRAEPWVMTMPKIEKERFYTAQWDDYWGYVLDNPGSVIDGNGGVSVMFASPSWKGETPKGVARVVRGESDLLGTLTRTQLIGGEKDLPRVKEIQKCYKLEPLSTFLGSLAPPPAPKVEWPQWKEGDETKEAYWEYVALMLPFATPHPADEAAYEKLAALGLKSGQPWDASRIDPKVREAMQQGIDDAIADMKKRSEGGIDAGKFFGTRQQVGTDYMSRALGVYGHLRQYADSFGVPLDAFRRRRRTARRR